jgi:hypothetical protein
MPDRRSGFDRGPSLIWRGFGAEGRVPDTEHNGFDDPGPEHQNATNQRDGAQASRAAADDQEETPYHERRRNDPEESRVLDNSIAF